MPEEQSLEVTSQRIGQIRQAIRASQAQGITDRAQMREAVIDAKGAQEAGVLKKEIDASQIPSVARPIDTESSEVIGRAKDKYLEIKEGKPGMPAVVDALHGQPPSAEETLWFLKQKYPDLGIEQVNQVVEKIARGEQLTELEQEIKRLAERYDSFTDQLATRTADLAGAHLVLVKKSRLFVDANRAWWYNFGLDIGKIPTTEGKAKGFRPREYPRSLRAAIYWTLKELLQKGGLSGKEGQLSQPVLRLSLHGMKEREKFDFVVAGHPEIADEEIRKWFTQRLEQEIAKFGLKRDNGQETKVLTAMPDSDWDEFSGHPSLVSYRQEVPRPHHPPFGKNFNIIQLEINTKLLADEKKREAIAQLLAKIVKEFPQQQ
jgi:hypothetical protein